MKTIKVTAPNGNSLAIVISHIVMFTPLGKGTEISLSNGEYQEVKEDIETLLKWSEVD